MKGKGNRQEKIGEEIRREVSSIIHFELSDPRVHGVTVTGVKMSPDLSLARVYFTVPGEPQRAKEAMKGLKSGAGLIRKRVAAKIKIKFMPVFDFFYDESLELQERIDSLFLEIEGKNVKSEK